MQRRELLRVVATITVASGLVIAAAQSATATDIRQIDAAVPSPPGFPLKIGIVVPLTGRVQGLGEAVRDGALVAIEQAQAAGWTIETVYGDSQCDSQQAISVTNDLIFNQGVHYIIGAVCSSASIPMSEIAEANRVVQISPASTNPWVTVNPDGTNKEYVFRVPFLDPFQGKAMAAVAAQEVGAAKAAVLYNEHNDYVSGLAQHFREYFQEMGGDVPVFESYAGNATDFTDPLTQVDDADVDVLFVPDYYSKVNQIAQQAEAVGVDVPFLGADGWDSPLLELELLEGAFFSTHYSPVDPRQVVVDFVETYSSTHAHEPDVLAAVGYDGAGILLQSIAESGVDDTTAVKDAMAAIDYEGITGNVQFNKFGDPLKGAAVVAIQDLETEFVKFVSPISGLSAENSSPTELGHSTVFTATVTTGYGVTYTWGFGDGCTAEGQTVSHTYGAPGTYTSVVTATNATNSAKTQYVAMVFSSRVYLPLVLRR